MKFYEGATRLWKCEAFSECLRIDKEYGASAPERGN